MSEAEKERFFILDTEYAKCIAHAALDFGTLEYQANDVIWRLASIHTALGACITAQIFTLDNRLKAILALMKLRQMDQKLIDRVNRFSERVREANELRNRILHDMWLISGDRKSMSQLEVTAKGQLSYKLKKIEIEELKNDCAKIRERHDEFNEIRYDIADAIASLPPIPREAQLPILSANRAHRQTPPSDAQ
jgi:hypothetical protein